MYFVKACCFLVAFFLVGCVSAPYSFKVSVPIYEGSSGNGAVVGLSPLPKDNVDNQDLSVKEN